MINPVRDVDHLILPIRSRTTQAHDSNILAKLSLADRIADLPGVCVVDHEPDSGERHVDVFLATHATALRKQRRPTMLCVIDATGIVVHALTDADRYQAVSRRWGRLHGQEIYLFMPRDNEELEVVWQILLRSYSALVNAKPFEPTSRPAIFDELPRFSRTNLQ